MEGEIKELQNENATLKTYLAVSVFQIENQKSALKNLDNKLKKK